MYDKKINFLTENIGANQCAFFMIQAANKLSESADFAPTIFYEELHRPCMQPCVPTMLAIEAWAQPGITIATSMSTALKLLKFPAPAKKVFYIWDLNWLRHPVEFGPLGRLFSSTEIFCNREITIIARCQDHADVISNNFNRSVDYIFDNFEYKPLKEMIKHEYNRKT